MTLTDAGRRSEPARFVLLTRTGDLTTANVLAARLRAEGFEVRVHGQALGPYPMTVGEMAEMELWVLNDRVEEASRVLLDAEVNEAVAPVEGSAPLRAAAMPLEFRLLAAVTVIVLLVLVALRFITVY